MVPRNAEETQNAGGAGIAWRRSLPAYGLWDPVIRATESLLRGCKAHEGDVASASGELSSRARFPALSLTSQVDMVLCQGLIFHRLGGGARRL